MKDLIIWMLRNQGWSLISTSLRLLTNADALRNCRNMGEQKLGQIAEIWASRSSDNLLSFESLAELYSYRCFRWRHWKFWLIFRPLLRMAIAMMHSRVVLIATWKNLSQLPATGPEVWYLCAIFRSPSA